MQREVRKRGLGKVAKVPRRVAFGLGLFVESVRRFVAPLLVYLS
jgi:hypothetical protein